MGIDSYFFWFVITFTVGGYSVQAIKILREKSSAGVSELSYLVSAIAVASMLIFSQTAEVYYIALVELVVCLLSLLIVHLHRDKTDVETVGTSFYFALAMSFFMIHGVMQTIKSWKHEGMSKVSVNSYFLWIAIDIVIIYLADSIFVVMALSISIALYCYIILTALKSQQSGSKIK